MVKLFDSGVYLLDGKTLVPENEAGEAVKATKEEARRGTIAYGILQAHNVSGDPENLKIKFDAITSHDLTYVGIIQTARASGLDKFPLPYVLTCCHNSLCAVGGTINEDDHVFGLTACRKYGGIYLPPHMPAQRDVIRRGGTDGGPIHLTRGGVYTGGISIPCRYGHSPAALVDLGDVKACADLAAAFAESKLEKEC